MPIPILTLPGINGSGSGHWQTLWERSVPGARRVTAPDWDRPVCAEWVETLERAVADAGRDVILVAHSLGCLQVVHWARDTRLSVRGALLVAPPDPGGPAFPAAAVGFAPVPPGRLPFPSTLIHSADDPYASAAFVRRCADDWGSRLVEISPCGHINADSGLGDWAEGRRWLEGLMAGSRSR
jgi:serine hydrolase